MADLYGDFQAEDLEENEDDIGALGSILSWDEEDEDDDGQAVNRSAAAMSSALRERETSAGTSAPPDMVQFSMKDGIPQFNFLSNATAGMNALANGKSNNSNNNNNTNGAAPQTNNGDGNPSSITLQLPMPTPISNFESNNNSFNSQPLQTPPNAEEEQTAPQPQQAPGNNNSQPQQSVNTNNNQQTQQGLAATFAQLLAQQAGTLFQQQQQQQQPPAQQNNPPQQQPQTQPKTQPQPVGTQAQQQAAQVIQQAQQQLQLAQQQAMQQAQQQPAQQQQQSQPAPIQPPQAQQQVQQQQQPGTTQNSNQAANANSQQQTPQMTTPQLQLPFGTDPNAFLQQLQFAHFQQQMQLQAQQQQQQGQAVAPAPAVPNAVSLPFAQAAAPVASSGPSLNPRKQPSEGRPPPAKKARKTKASASKPAAAKSAPKKAPSSASLAGPASKAGVVSASDTDCDTGGKNNKDKKAPPSISPSDPVPSSVPPVAAAAAAKSCGNKSEGEGRDKSDSNMSADEKAQANRDRNREHARNTRLRKKAYLEKLKTTVEELCRERDTLVSERAGAASLLVEMHNTRTEVLMSFFALRSSNEKRRKLWSSILDESSFTCVMPVTPYRSFPASEVQVSKCQRTIMGIDAMMSDTSSLHVLFQSLVDQTRFPNAKIEFRYTLVTEESVVAGNQMMARWVMSTVNATKCGALTEVAKQGMLCCKFNSSHRIIGLELMFDVMAFMLQLKQAAGSDSFSVIPNTVQTCQRTFDKPMVMTLADPPFTIVQVNKLWEEMTGYNAEEVVGKASCRILQGAKMDKSTLSPMMEEIRFKRPGAAYIQNVKKTGEAFLHNLLVFPLSTDSRVTHYVALSNHVELCAAKTTLPPQDAAATLPQATPQATLAANTIPPVQNGVAAPQAIPQFFMSSSPTPMTFHPQAPQPVVSNKIQMPATGATSVMAPPPNAPQATAQPPA